MEGTTPRRVESTARREGEKGYSLKKEWDNEDNPGQQFRKLPDDRLVPIRK